MPPGSLLAIRCECSDAGAMAGVFSPYSTVFSGCWLRSRSVFRCILGWLRCAQCLPRAADSRACWRCAGRRPRPRPTVPWRASTIWRTAADAADPHRRPQQQLAPGHADAALRTPGCPPSLCCRRRRRRHRHSSINHSCHLPAGPQPVIASLDPRSDIAHPEPPVGSHTLDPVEATLCWTPSSSSPVIVAI